jgi:type II secretory pathway pseudopilin PulG
MELLVVLLIIGILSTVALRTIDATRDRSLFDQTTAEMNKLVQAIVGNPDLSYDGRRVDFGYYGDMEKLPATLQDLLKSDGNPAWRGPYIKLMDAGDTVSYLYDGWGGLYTYKPDLIPPEISSEGGGKYSMTVNLVDDITQLTDNSISGTFLDSDDNPPAAAINSYEVRLYYNNPDAHGGTDSVVVHPAPGGYYEIAKKPSDPVWPSYDVPIGTKKLQAIIPGETLTRYVTITPRSHVVADLKFNSLFAGGLKMVGDPTVGLFGKAFRINVTNTRAEATTVSWLRFLPTSDTLYLKDDFSIGDDHAGFPRPTGLGPGDSIEFTTPVTIAPDGLIELYFQGFYAVRNPTGINDSTMIVTGHTFKFRFSDGSQISVSPSP